MSESLEMSGPALSQLLDDESLRDWIAHQRWYGAKARSVAGVEIVEHLTLREVPPLVLTLAQTRFATGTHELYQLPLLLLEGEHRGSAERLELGGAVPIASDADWALYDGLADPGQAHELLWRIAAGEDIESAHGHFTFR